MAEVMGDRQQESLHHPVVQELCDWVEAAQDRRAGFHQAIFTATNKGVTDIDDIYCLSNWFSFLNSLLL